MSEPTNALGGVRYDGIAMIEEAGPRGMVTLRGDLDAPAFQKVAIGVAGVAFPARRAIVLDGDRGLAWMSPDELLLMMPYEAAGDAVAALGERLGDAHHLAVDVSDARAVFRVSGGAAAREVLAKLCPVDLSPAAFEPGQIRRTRAAQVPVAFWMADDDSFDLVCFRSVARYVFDLLSTAAAPGGTVGYFRHGA